MRYSYKVEPRDLEQVTASEIERSAMAIRNTVVDGDGNRIVGLFGADNRVDYDDFFIFADHFGLTAESDLYEAAFDIIPNDVIDVDDFFAFAESFGKEVAGIGKAVPTLAGLNSDARFYIDNAAAELPPRRRGDVSAGQPGGLRRGPGLRVHRQLRQQVPRVCRAALREQPAG